ncbi:hypothetical protein EMPS_01818 [Entomortierella parvispora]|uniref:Uncharacterized protein n=1 Tax=Entomortierella parvispora TaxID=205924 RepID=A0A9P3LT55_9FUNG|nr:hypothetical protein EMPS_01818 [Entomortierella parvispora]
MCGFNYVLKKRARFYELISYRGIRIAITVLVVLVMLFPSGYLMKACVLLSGYNDSPDVTPVGYLHTLRHLSTNMEDMTIFPICNANSNRNQRMRHVALTPPKSVSPMDAVPEKDATGKDTNTPMVTSSPMAMATPMHFVSIFPGPFAPHISNSNILSTGHHSQRDQPQASPSESIGHQQQQQQQQQQRQPGQGNNGSGEPSVLQNSWAWVSAGIDVVGSSHLASLLLYPFINDRIWFFLLCRLQHLHLGFFLLGSASNVYMACQMLSDMYDLVMMPSNSHQHLQQPHLQPSRIKKVFLALTSVFVIWFWFSYNLMAFRVSTTEEEFMSELPLWALRWINVGVAIVDLSYRRIYNRLGRLKVEEELLDISDVEKVEEMQQKAWLHQQQRFLQYGQEQGQYLLGQFKAFEVKQSFLNGANAAVDAVSDAYSKTNIPSFPPIPTSFASAVTMMSTSTSASSSFPSDSEPDNDKDSSRHSSSEPVASDELSS